MARKESDLRSIVRSSGTLAASRHGQKGVDHRTWAFVLPPLIVLIVGLGLPLPGILTGLIWLLAAGVGVASASYARTYRAGAKAALGSGSRGPRQLG